LVKLRFSRRLVHALICALVCGAVAGLFCLEANRRIGLSLTSWEYRFRDAVTASGRILPPDPRLVFLGIDSSSVNFSQFDLQTLYANVPAASPEGHALNLIAGGWPWSREVYALVAERLLAAGARGVVFDLLLPKPGAGDDILRATIARHPDRIVFGANFANDVIGPGEESPSLNLPTETAMPNDDPKNPAIGYVNLWPGFNGVIRSARYYTTLELLLAEMRGVELAPPARVALDTPTALAARGARWLRDPGLTNPFQARLLRFSGPPGTYIPIPLYQIFLPTYWKGNFGNGALLREKVIVVGPAGNWAHDEHPTAFGFMPGPELQLQSINALIHHAFLREWPAWSTYGLIAAGCLAAFLLTILIVRTSLRVAAFVLLGAAFLFGVKLAYDYASAVVPGIPPTFAFALSGLASFIYDYTREKMEKMRVRRTLESYVSKEVVRDILDNPASYLNALGGQRTSCALIMTDLRGFTTLSEQMDSHQLVRQLNEYLSLMVEDIFALRGSIDKFIGDAILAVWGNLNSAGPAQDAKAALQAALRMQASLRKLNLDWTRRGLQTFAMGCGLNYGEVVFGNIGSAKKMEPTVIGDTVNVTARLEGLTKDYGRELLLGEAAAELVRDEYTLQFVDRVAVKGKSKALKLYGVVAPASEKIEQVVQDCLGTHDQACTAYQQRDFLEASRLFRRCRELCPDDVLPSLYLERCDIFIEKPPPEDWTGIWVAEHK
jgi:adenylate cyclase